LQLGGLTITVPDEVPPDSFGVIHAGAAGIGIAADGMGKGGMPCPMPFGTACDGRLVVIVTDVGRRITVTVVWSFEDDVLVWFVDCACAAP